MSKKVSLQDIADSLGISRGTVDRAIHGRGRINPETRNRVISEARRLGYIDRKVNSFLPLQNPSRILALIPGGDPFFTKIETGIKKAVEENPSGPDFFLVNVPHEEPEEQARIMGEFLSEGGESDGILIVPSRDEALCEVISGVEKAGTRVITLNTDAPDSGRSLFVGQDLYASGRTAAELMLNFNIGPVLILSGFDNIWAHSERVRGFLDLYRECGRLNEIIGPYFTGDKIERTADILRKLPDSFNAVFTVSGLTTEGAGLELFRAARDGSGIPFLLGFDCTDENISLLRAGAIKCLISQSPQLQGYLAVRRLTQLLKNDDSLSAGDISIPIEIYFRENIDYYRNHLEL